MITHSEYMQKQIINLQRAQRVLHEWTLTAHPLPERQTLAARLILFAFTLREARDYADNRDSAKAIDSLEDSSTLIDAIVKIDKAYENRVRNMYNRTLKNIKEILGGYD